MNKCLVDTGAFFMKTTAGITNPVEIYRHMCTHTYLTQLDLMLKNNEGELSKHARSRSTRKIF